MGGCILGIIGAVFGGMIGVSVGFYNDVKAYRVPTGTFFGAIAGAHVGASLGYRLPDRLIKNPEQHALHYSIRELHRTFESLTALSYEDTLAELMNEILNNNFKGDKKTFENFLIAEIPYTLRTADAGLVLSEKVQGFLGHHLWITFKLPGQAEFIRIESGAELSIDENTKSERITQTQYRSTNGKKLLEMLALHRVLSPIYVLKLKPEYFGDSENIEISRESRIAILMSMKSWQRLVRNREKQNDLRMMTNL